MKRIYLIALLVAIRTTVFGENTLSYNPEVIFDNESFEISGYGAPVFRGIYLKDRTHFQCGGEGGAIIDHSFIIGGGGMGLTLGIDTGSNSKVMLGWGGLMIGYIFMPEIIVHPYLKVLIGGGDVEEFKQGTYCPINTAPFFIMDAQIGTEINVSSWMRIASFVGYQFVYGPFDFDGITDKDLCGFNFGIKLEFGFF